MAKIVITVEDSEHGVLITSEPSLHDLLKQIDLDEARRIVRGDTALSLAEQYSVKAWAVLASAAMDHAKATNGSYSAGNLN